MIFNGIIFLTVVRILLKKRKAVQRKAGGKGKGVLKTLISIVAIMMLFGITWVFGVFTIGGASVVFQFLFAITNSFEGFFVFLFLCVLREDVRELWKEFLCCRKKKRRRTTGISYNQGSRGLPSSRSRSSGSGPPTKSTSRLQKTDLLYSSSASSDVFSESENAYALEPHYDSPMHLELPTIPEESTLTELAGNRTADQPEVYKTDTVHEYTLEPCYATIEIASNIEESDSEDEPTCDSEVAPHIAIRHKLSAAMKEVTERNKKEDELGLVDNEVAPHILARMRQVSRIQGQSVDLRPDSDEESMITCIVNPNAEL